MSLSRDQLLERFGAKVRSYEDDLTGFCRYVLGFEPHAGQQRWFENSSSDENAIMTGNRWGKSHSAGAKIIHRAFFRKGWNDEIAAAMAAKNEYFHAINVSITAAQSRLVWDKADAMLQGPRASWMVRDIVQTPFPRITLVNGSIIEARSTDNDGRRLLGNSYDFVNWDETAYERNFIHVRDNVLRMRLADRSGMLDYTSTGNGRNDFGQYFLTGLPGPKKDPELYSQTGSTRENPNIDQTRVDKNAARMSEKMRRQNIEGEVIDSGGSFFSAEDLREAHSAELDEYLQVIRDDEDIERHCWLKVDGIPWKARYPSHRYLHGWDLADKADWCVGLTYDTTTRPAKLVEFERFQKQGWDYNYSRIRDRHHRYGTSRATKIDSTGLGDVVQNELKDIRAEGLNFAGGRKDAGLANLQTRLAMREMCWPLIKVFVDEHAFYERDDAKLVQDCVMANVVAAWFLVDKPRFSYAEAI